jgi:eukaryotic-like serine/threonine-protein kinase
MSMIGKTLGNFEITSQLGKGGMGEVYKAKDRKLGRDVAIKVLPEEFARDADRVARFQREAKLLASLNHPNIAAIHGLEESGGTNFLVLELVEGETLADRIRAGPIPVEEALKSALQISEALEAAHEKGVIHRDLKPSNIKLTPEGKVKVLDFGLAKAFAGDQEVNLSNSPTLSDAATQQGVILGTAAYMSPEQAKGKAVDKRADIWAFGVVLFEMLTGRQLFTGETVSETLAAVLMRNPEFSMLPSDLHPRIRLLLERCLEKDIKNRYSSIADARVDIQKALTDQSGVLRQAPIAEKLQSRWRLVLPWVAATLVLTAIVAGLAVWKLKPVEPRQVMRFEYSLPEGEQFSNLRDNCLAVSPDGRQFVYSTTRGLYLRSVDELTAKLIPGTEGSPSQSFFSPDGKWIGYYSSADRKLKKISVNGGAAVALCDVQILGGACWSEDNTIVYGQVLGNAIMRISANGGIPTPVLKINSVALFPLYPKILPDGKSLLYSVSGGSGEQAKIMVRSLKSGVSKELFPGYRAQYLSSGHIVYWVANNNSVFAIPFDAKRLEVTGESIPVVENVGQVAVSDSGTLAYIPARSVVASGRTLVWVDREGKEEPIEAPTNNYAFPKISPDGKQIALTIDGANTDIWIWDLARKASTRLTFNEKSDFHAIWTPDGKRIIFVSDRDGKYGIYWKASDGTGTEELLGSKPDLVCLPFSFSTDGKSLLTMEMSADLSKINIGILSLDGDHNGKTLLQNGIQPQISPDGRWMVYSWGEYTKQEVYMRPFPDVDKGNWQASTGGGVSSCPRWSPDGKELFYMNNDGALMAVAVAAEPTLRFGQPKVLFRGPYVRPSTTSSIPYDISPDGKRFLMMKEPIQTGTSTDPRQINIVLNWFEELKQRVPAK